jgi:metal-responsive CopG/Arc/MetJ family transcriptional regulator
MDKNKVIRVRVSGKFLERVDNESKKRGMTRSDFVRFALENTIQSGQKNN